jgi:hypothetical protein
MTNVEDSIKFVGVCAATGFTMWKLAVTIRDDLRGEARRKKRLARKPRPSRKPRRKVRR